jgi:hypothetical protein
MKSPAASEAELSMTDYTTSDLVIFIRNQIQDNAIHQPLEIFLQRAELINIADRSFWLHDYSVLSNLKDGSKFEEMYQYYDGLNG